MVEVKIWGRGDYREIQRQIESYWTSGVEAGAVVMVSDTAPDDWPAVYRDRCLPVSGSAGHEAPGPGIEVHEVPGSPIRARISFRAVSEGVDLTVDHFLLRLARR